MKYITLLVPTYIVLRTIWDLGEVQEAYVMNGEMIVAAIILSFGLWFLGYLTGSEK